MTTWTTPPDFTIGQVLTQPEMQIISDDLEHLNVSPVIGLATDPLAIDNDVTTDVDFTTERFKRDITHSNVTTPSRAVITQAGIYVITFTVDWDIDADGRRYSSVGVNGTPIRNISVPAFAAAAPSSSLAFHHNLAVGDYVTASVYQNSGGALNAYPNLDIVWAAHYP